MKNLLKLSVIGALLLCFAIVSCKKESKSTTTTQAPINYTDDMSGLGPNSGTPAGIAFAIPSFIKIVDSIVGGDPGNKGNSNIKKTLDNIPSTSKSSYTEYGIGTYVNVYAKLYNASFIYYKLIIPSGLIMCDHHHQCGFIALQDTIIMNPRDTVRACIRSFCLNHTLPAPSNVDTYTLTLLTSNESLHQVATILTGKKSLSSHISNIQSILWDITDGSGLSQADIDLMNSWN